MDQILKESLNSLYDISINAATVHYTGHSELETEQTYKILEEVLIQSCQE